MADLANNFAKFKQEVSLAGGLLPLTQVGRFVKRVSFQVLKGVIFRTPVDTGRARGGWLVTVGSPTKDESDQGTDRTGNTTLAKGTAVIASAKEFKKIFIDNNVNYIEFLEDGSSAQAPAGIVGPTLDEVGAAAKLL